MSAGRHNNDRADSQVSFPGGLPTSPELRSDMAPKNTLNAQNLETLGAKRLAELLIEITSQRDDETVWSSAYQKSLKIAHGVLGWHSMAVTGAGLSLASHRLQACAPPLGGTLQRDMVGEAVARDMFAWNFSPAAVLDRHARFVPDLLEADCDFGVLLRCEGRVAPGKGEFIRRRPGDDFADLKHPSARQRRDKAAANLALEAQRPVAARRDPKKATGLPPHASLFARTAPALARSDTSWSGVRAADKSRGSSQR